MVGFNGDYGGVQFAKTNMYNFNMEYGLDLMKKLTNGHGSFNLDKHIWRRGA